MNERTNVIVTGGSGFIGSHLIEFLTKQDRNVFNYDIQEGNDLLDKPHLNQIFYMLKPNEVYHLGGSVHMGPAEEDPEMDIKTNYIGTLNILKQCEKYGSRFLFTGTGASYGVSGLQHEDDLPRPMSNYGISKRATELLIQKYVECHGIHGTIVRYSSVYGPGRNAGPVNLMLKNALEKGWIRVDGPGHHTRDILNIEDALDGIVLVMEKGIPGEIYNIGTGVETSIVEVAWIIHELTDAEIRHVPYKYSKFDIPRSKYDISKASSLGFKPKVLLREGIAALLKEMSNGRL